MIGVFLASSCFLLFLFVACGFWVMRRETTGRCNTALDCVVSGRKMVDVVSEMHKMLDSHRTSSVLIH